MQVHVGHTYRHLKTQSCYKVLSLAKWEEDGSDVVIYQSFTDSSQIWVRRLEIFVDGRFQWVAAG